MLHVDFTKIDFTEYSMELMLLNEFLLTIEEIKNTKALNSIDYLKILELQHYLTIDNFKKIMNDAKSK